MRELKPPKTPEEEILAAIADLSQRMAKLETLGNELVVGHMENAALIEALVKAIEKAPQIVFGGVEVETPPDLDLNSWIEAEKKRRSD